MLHIKTGSLLALASTASAHFFLNNPPTIGFDDSTMDDGPCGGFDPSLRDGPVTDWPVNGHPVSLVSTHQNVVWHVEAALLSDPTNFVPVVVPFAQSGVGEICFETVPGKASWVGEQVVVSIYQVTNHGDLYQCVAARFTEGPAAEVPSSCTNFDGVTHDPIVAAPDDDDDDDEETTTTTATTVPPTTTSTSDSDDSTATSDDHQHSHSHDHSDPPASATESDDHSHGHGTPTPTPTPTGGDDHDHGDGDDDDDDHHGHDHGDGESSVIDAPSNGTAPEPSPSHVEAGAARFAAVGAAYLAVGAAVVAVY